jgi:branched-chain amino acid transport system substrate-binding protein
MKFGFTAIATVALLLSNPASAQNAPIRVGLMLPATGTYASLGTMIENGFKLYVSEQGGKLAGREIQYFKVDDESDPAKATDNVNKLVKRDRVDVLVGTVHSGVALAMAKVAKETNTLLIVPNAGAEEYFPHVFQQLAAGVCNGQGGRGARTQERCHHHLELRSGHRIRKRIRRRL